MPRAIKFLLSILSPLVIGGISGALTAGAVNGWYATLIQPSFNPPNWVFGPVWTLLYVLMGISHYRIWSRPKTSERTHALRVFWLQLALNFFWSLIFFGAGQITWALVEILLLWCCIAWMIRCFYAIDRTSAWINLPYVAWVSFATALNAAYAWLNG
ncbi:MAG: TspO/MBR family protein [Bacteroidota bacterium]